ncbi:DUF1367 family protein [Candidatus Pacearchaeota archaeon]|nr:DUF1367 family protein [Candidatus Pacearchaeota archaeon]
MPISLTVYRNGGMLVPALQDDKDQLRGIKQGQAFRIEATRVSPRSFKMHQLYFGGLLELAMIYWEPVGGLITDSERSILKMYNKRLCKLGGEEESLNEVCEQFLVDLTENRSHRVESPSKDKEVLHHEVVIAAGYFDWYHTPMGLKKVPKSINFASMDQKDFNKFYRAAHSVVWNMVLRNTFESLEDQENAVNELLAMG